MSRSVLRFATTLVLVALAACSARAGGPVPAEPEPTTADARLRRALSGQSWGEEQTAELQRFEAELGAAALHLALARTATDPAAPLPARINAVLQIGDREVRDAAVAFGAAARDTSHLVRAAVMVAAGQKLAGDREHLIPILEAGLGDPDPLVQAKALQSLGEVRPDLLRRFLAADRPDELRGVALDLLNLALQRGAPWADSADVAAGGDLVRVTPTGLRLVFRPTRSWSSGPAAVGELLVAADGAEPRRIAGAVEVVAGVVPAILSPDERWLAVETGREIRVVDLETRAERVVGQGIAPRPVPFSDRFVFLVPRPEETRRGARSTELVYDVFEARFDGGSTRPAGGLRATASPARLSSYSTARVMRVAEGPAGGFVLEVPGSGTFPLPEPFSGGVDDTRP